MVDCWFVVIEMTHHARHRTSEMCVEIEEVERTLTHPWITYPGAREHGAGRRVSVADRLAVVHTNDATPIVITVLWNGRSSRQRRLEN